MELETKWLPIKELPEGNGWQIFSGNSTHNSWWRVTRGEGEGREVLMHTKHFVPASGSTIL